MTTFLLATVLVLTAMAMLGIGVLLGPEAEAREAGSS